MIDVIGYELEEARRLLEAAGFIVQVVETSPPRRVALHGQRRVVRQRVLSDGLVELVACHERYEEGARSPEAHR